MKMRFRVCCVVWSACMLLSMSHGLCVVLVLFFLMYVHVFVQGTISFSLNLHMTFTSISLQVVHHNDNNKKKQGCCIQTEMLD